MRNYNIQLYFVLLLTFLFVSTSVKSQQQTVKSPDGKLSVTILVNNGIPLYNVSYRGNTILENSPLGLVTNEGDFSTKMSLTGSDTGVAEKEYTLEKIKQSNIKYTANTLTCNFKNADDKEIAVLFQVSNNDIAFRYEIPNWGPTMACVVEKETTGFRFPSFTTAYLSNMMTPMTGFARTAPSYESGYETDAPISTTKSPTGYVFPGLFHVGDNGWALISETGVRSLYCGSHLSNYSNGLYTVEYPDPDQNNGFGSTGAQIGLPGVTPWRTITVGQNLKPIVETTIPYDVVEQLYEPSEDYEYGRSTWSWIVWQDGSINYDDQVKYIDLSAEMGFEYVLIDNWWDTRIGYEKMEELIKYADSKGVGVFLWYNSNGSFNDAPQGPRNKMNTSIARKQEMKWLKSQGVKGLKVDFFGGDKQETMRFYEDILSDANDYGLMIIFHGTTLSRGWEKMFPNFVGGEAVLASEMLIFSQGVRDSEAFYATLHPFIRNAVAGLEFGGVFLNKHLNKGNKEGKERLTTDAFQLATSVLFQNPVHMYALTPNNPTDAPAFQVEFMKEVPTTWDETVFIDGYPGKYCVLARRHKDQWYIVGVNAQKEALNLTLDLPMIAGKTVTYIGDNDDMTSFEKELKIKKSGSVDLTIQPNGGIVLK